MEDLSRFLDHPLFKEEGYRRPPATRLSTFLWALGRITPYVWEQSRRRKHFLMGQATAVRGAFASQEHLSRYVFYPTKYAWEKGNASLPAGLGIAHPSMRSPSPWAEPTGLEGTLENPPSNYLIGQYIFNVAHPFPRRGTEEEKWARALYAWFLLGLPREALEPYFRGKEFEYWRDLAQKQLMQTPRFRLWSLGMDLMPAIMSPREAQVLLFEGKMRDQHLILEGVAQRPYARALLINGGGGRKVKHLVPKHWKPRVMRTPWDLWKARGKREMLFRREEQRARFLAYGTRYEPLPSGTPGSEVLMRWERANMEAIRRHSDGDRVY